MNGGSEPQSADQIWFNVGTQQTILTPSCSSTSIEYSVAFLDRRTLVPKTGGNDTAQCFSSGQALQQFLAGLASQSSVPNDLVIVGTNYTQGTDAWSGAGVFDTRAIGGHAFNCSPNSNLGACAAGGQAVSPDIPVQYLAIGVLNAKAGSAFEYYYNSNESSVASPAFAYGMLVEDASGNYNFQPTMNVEYTVAPGVDASSTSVTVTGQPYGPTASSTKVVYTPPSGSANGFWLLTLRRDTLGEVTQCPRQTNPTNSSEIDVPNCGTFYAIAGSNGAYDIDTIVSLAAALNNVNRAEVAILTTVGTAGWAGPLAMAESLTKPTSSQPQNTLALAVALQAYGIPDKSITSTGVPRSTYTVVGTPGLGGPLNGHNVLSSSEFGQQGHTGYVHGIFARGSDGLYESERSEQEPNASSDTANYQLGVVLAQPPVEWPEFVGSPLLGYNNVAADSLAGQEDAYRYLSWYLLNTWYVRGQYQDGVLQEGVSEKPEKYDMHYFYTGSLNTLIDYHTFDPLNAAYPTNAPKNCGCTWKNPNGDGTTLTFTENDFNAVKAQLHNELVDLNNVLTYMVNGSTNVKDVVAAGNSNAALTLLQALATVQSNITQKAIDTVHTPAVVSPWHIVQMIGSDVSPYVSLATDGIINAGDIALADKAIGFIGDMFQASGSTGGGLSSGDPTNSKEIPRLNYQLTTTIADLAGLDLQDQFLAGFDAALDTITSDAGRLDALGNVAVKDQALFAPTQITQNQAIGMITRSEQKSLYLSLIPAIYQVHLWPQVIAAGYPDMGFTSSGDTGSCTGYYFSSEKTTNVSKPYTSYGGILYEEAWQGSSGDAYPFRYDTLGGNGNDYYVLALPFTTNQNQGYAASSDLSTPVMDQSLADLLFGNAQGAVNFSFDEFIAQRGPMDLPISGASSALFNAAITQANSLIYSVLGMDSGSVCSVVNVGGKNADGTKPPSSTSSAPPVGPPANATTATLQVAPSAVLGDSLPLSAHVVRNASVNVPAGLVQFRDGSNVLGSVVLDGSGSAAYTTTTLAIGTHALAAYYLPNDGSLASNSAVQTTTIYAEAPNLSLALSNNTVQASYGTVSTPIQLTVNSSYGMSGTVQFSCIGLPVNMSCTFAPPQAVLTPNGSAATSFTVSGSTAAASSLWPGALGLLSIPMSLLLLAKLRRGSTFVRSCGLLSVFLIACISVLSGCSSGSNNGSSTQLSQQKGTLTAAVQVSGGGLTRTIPLVINVQ